MTTPAGPTVTEPKAQMQLCCRVCRHWFMRIANPIDMDKDEGECHRFPPMVAIVNLERRVTVSYWPGPKPNAICGEFKPRLGIASTAPTKEQ